MGTNGKQHREHERQDRKWGELDFNMLPRTLNCLLFTYFLSMWGYTCASVCSSEDMRVLYFHVVCSRRVNSGSQSRKRSLYP